jgi:hypothetical protein
VDRYRKHGVYLTRIPNLNSAKRTPALAATWPGAAVDLCATVAQRVAVQLRLQDLGLRGENLSSVTEIDCQAASETRQTATTSCWNQAITLKPTLVAD